MKNALITVLVAGAAAFFAQRWSAGSRAALPAADGSTAGSGADGVQSLLQEIEALRRDNHTLGEEVVRLSGQPSGLREPVAGVSEGEIAAAVERWRKAHA